MVAFGNEGLKRQRVVTKYNSFPTNTKKRKYPTNPTPFLKSRTGSFSYFIHLPNPETAATVVAFSNKP